MKYLEGQIIHRSLLAQYWIAVATTGLAKDIDLISRAMNIAHRHITLVGEMIENLAESPAFHVDDVTYKSKRSPSFEALCKKHNVKWSGEDLTPTVLVEIEKCCEALIKLPELYENRFKYCQALTRLVEWANFYLEEMQ